MAIPETATAVNLVEVPVTAYDLGFPESLDDEKHTYWGGGGYWRPDGRKSVNNTGIVVTITNVEPLIAAGELTVYFDLIKDSTGSFDVDIEISANEQTAVLGSHKLTFGTFDSRLFVSSGPLPEWVTTDLSVKIRGLITGNVVRVSAARVAPGPDDGLGVIYGGDDSGAVWSGDPWISASYIPYSEPEPIEVTAPEPLWTEDLDNGGGSWATETIEGIEYTPASGTASPGETVTITATALDGYVLLGDTEWSHTFPATPEPDPEPDPEPEPEPLDLAEHVLRFAGIKPTEQRLALAREHVETVTAYVHGYTRGRGFKDGRPAFDLERVIIAATARLTVNPKQMTYYSTGDYSERPAVLAGWTLLERAVLNNYRRTWA